jgi:hypothetical protein
MNYWYSGVADAHAELGLYYTNRTITAQDVAGCLQVFISSNSTTVLPICSSVTTVLKPTNYFVYVGIILVVIVVLLVLGLSMKRKTGH